MFDHVLPNMPPHFRGLHKCAKNLMTSKLLINKNKETSQNKPVGKYALSYTKIGIKIVWQKLTRTRPFVLSFDPVGRPTIIFRTEPPHLLIQPCVVQKLDTWWGNYTRAHAIFMIRVSGGLRPLITWAENLPLDPFDWLEACRLPKPLDPRHEGSTLKIF